MSTKEVPTNKPTKLSESPEFKSKVYNHISKYAKPNDLKAWFHVCETFFFFGLIVYLAMKNPLTSVAHWIAEIFLVVALGGIRVRVFILFHDMAHHSYFSSNKLNAIMATIVGLFVFTPYSGWSHGHNYHHRHSNKTDRKQYAQTASWDIEQWSKSSKLMKALYAFGFSKYTLFTTTPILYFTIYNRITSTWYENLLQLIYALLLWNPHVATLKYFFIEIISGYISVGSGFFLFHVQHTFEGAYKAVHKDYDRFQNGMWGSSHFQVPWYFAYFTGRIEYHNIHHLNTKVPFYNLKQCWTDGYEELFKGNVATLTVSQAFKTISHSVRNDKERTFYDVTKLLF